MEIDVSPRAVSTPRVPMTYPSASTPRRRRRPDATHANEHIPSSTRSPHAIAAWFCSTSPSACRAACSVASLSAKPLREHALLTILEPPFLAALLVALRVDDPLVF